RSGRDIPAGSAAPETYRTAQLSHRPAAGRLTSHRNEQRMTKVREKAQGRTKQIVGQMVGDELLVEEGKEQERKADEQTGQGLLANDGPATPVGSQGAAPTGTPASPVPGVRRSRR